MAFTGWQQQQIGMLDHIGIVHGAEGWVRS